MTRRRWIFFISLAVGTLPLSGCYAPPITTPTLTGTWLILSGIFFAALYLSHTAIQNRFLMTIGSAAISILVAIFIVIVGAIRTLKDADSLATSVGLAALLFVLPLFFGITLGVIFVFVLPGIALYVYLGSALPLAGFFYLQVVKDDEWRAILSLLAFFCISLGALSAIGVVTRELYVPLLALGIAVGGISYLVCHAMTMNSLRVKILGYTIACILLYELSLLAEKVIAIWNILPWDSRL
jgi:hypothetical protein